MADMMRVVVGLTAWVAGTVIAVFVASLGANVVLRNAGAGQAMPVVNVMPPVSAAAPAPTVVPASTAPIPSQPTSSRAKSTPTARGATSHATPSASPGSATPSASTPATSGTVHDYAMTGGRVTLQETASSVQLVTAVPDAGYSVQTWSGTDWLRVDFSSGPQVSSLIASWYQHAPTVTVTN
ncbi:MAG TPA: hypothetical protein VMU95_06935 [Trebonia sp.]|nr:hypothetical protein [Trebonia sp.]